MTRLAVLYLFLSLAVPCAADGPALATPAGRRALAHELDTYLVRHVLAPRYPAAVDREHGGFHAHFATDWTREPDRRRFIVYQARMTWTPAAVALSRPALRDEHLAYVRHGVEFLGDRMWDAAHGGFRTSVLLDGTPDPDEPVKIAYGQAFAVYALAVAPGRQATPRASTSPERPTLGSRRTTAIPAGRDTAGESSRTGRRSRSTPSWSRRRWTRWGSLRRGTT